MKEQPELTKIAANWASGLDYDDIPENVKTNMLHIFVDWMACCIVGFREKPVKLLMDHKIEHGLGFGSSIIRNGKAASPTEAAFINAAAGHAVEFDDIYSKGAFHPATVIIPAALSAAEYSNVDGRTLLTAVIAGYEVGCRLSEMAGRSHYRYWHTTATVGTIAAAVAAGRALNLDSKQLNDAMGNAGTMAAGLWEFNRTGAMSKVLHSGQAASNGLMAAMLAKKGFTGAAAILEGRQGFLTAMTENIGDIKNIFTDFGRNYKVLEIMLKAYPSCGHTHTAIDAAKALRKDLLAADVHDTDLVDRIKSIDIYTNSCTKDLVGQLYPSSSIKARFSMPFCTATALLYGTVNLNHITDELNNDQLRQLQSKITLHTKPEYELTFPAIRTSEIIITLDNGDKHSRIVHIRKGEPGNPMDDRERTEKLVGMLSGITDEEGLAVLIGAVNILAKSNSIRQWITKLAQDISAWHHR